MSCLEYKRAAYWHHEARNEQIAALAKALQENDLAALWSLGLYLDRTSLPSPPPSIAILVQSQEHALALYRLLPDFKVLSYSQLSDAPRQRNAIVTETYAYDHEITQDVLINAAGHLLTPAHLQFPRLSEDEHEEQRLIDYDDEFHEQAQNYAKSRQEAYKHKRWL